jgi:hypothetical protein
MSIHDFNMIDNCKFIKIKNKLNTVKINRILFQIKNLFWQKRNLLNIFNLNFLLILIILKKSN